jgi:hypothetical protein
MNLDPKVRAALEATGLPYTIEKSKDHYFARVGDRPRVLVAGNHGKLKHGELKSTLKRIKRLADKG